MTQTPKPEPSLDLEGVSRIVRRTTSRQTLATAYFLPPTFLTGLKRSSRWG